MSLDRLNKNNDTLSFEINHENKLAIKSRSHLKLDDNFAISYLSDNNRFLSDISGILREPNDVFDSLIVNATDRLQTSEIDLIRTPSPYPSSWIEVSNHIVEDVNLIAAKGGTDYDGVNGSESAFGSNANDIALEISKLRHKNTLFDSKENFNEFYIAMIDKIGSANNIAISQVEKYEVTVNHLRELSS